MTLVTIIDSILDEGEVINIKGFTLKTKASCSVYVNDGQLYVKDVHFVDGYIWYQSDWVTKEWCLSPYKGTYMSALVIDELVAELKLLAISKVTKAKGDKYDNVA